MMLPPEGESGTQRGPGPQRGPGTQREGRVPVISAQVLCQTVSTYSVTQEPPWTLWMVPPSPRAIRVMQETERGTDVVYSTAAGPGGMSTQERNQFLS